MRCDATRQLVPKQVLHLRAGTVPEICAAERPANFTVISKNDIIFISS